MKISTIITTYNHEHYISQCLESVLMQKGDFQLEIIVGDDKSTDTTRIILDKYQELYPNIISLLPSDKNFGITKNLRRCLNACTGDYIAICEGDDFWTDNYKLQKQCDFLDRHPGYSACFHRIMLYYENTNLYIPHKEQLLLVENFITPDQLIECNYIGNFSCCMYRKSVVKKLPERIFDIYTVDWMFNLSCAQQGSIGYIKDWMSVYRIRESGAWSGKSEVNQINELLSLIDLYDEALDHNFHTQFSRKKEILITRINEITGLSKPENLLSDTKALSINDKVRKYLTLK